MQNTLGLKVFAPAGAGDESRFVAAVHGLERAFPGMHLEWTVSDEHQLIRLSQRDMWLAQTRRTRGIPFVCNNDESYPVTMSAGDISGFSGPGGQPLLDIHVDLPLESAVIAVAAEILGAVAEGASALWGEATPFNAAVDIARQTVIPVHRPVPPRGLPGLRLTKDLRSPEIPHHLGWLNYWSAAAARVIGFPDPARDADLLSRARRTASGGWVVPLTQEPLDLDKPEHLDALHRAYERFPVIGGRRAP